MSEKKIGERIRSIRLSKNLTISDISKRTGLSTGYLSQFERGITTISLDSLQKITDVLGVKMSEFFQSKIKHDTVVQKSFEPATMNIMGNYYIEKILPNPSEDVELYTRVITILPKIEEQEIKEYGHEGEEFIYVLEGILSFSYEGKKTYLYPGDSAHYISQKPHNWSNDTSKSVKILCVSLPIPNIED